MRTKPTQSIWTQQMERSLLGVAFEQVTMSRLFQQVDFNDFPMEIYYNYECVNEKINKNHWAQITDFP